jgi:hypothetical protein
MSGRPALLISYAYLTSWRRRPTWSAYRDWVLDSGAYTAWTKGTPVDLVQYIYICQELLAVDPTLTEIFALDVIGDWRGTRRNTELMWAAGIPAIPTYHPEEPEDVLIGYARDYPKIALGGVVGQPKAWKAAWVGQCFARVWPKKIHGLGMMSEELLAAYPFHSVDASNWEQGPCSFGYWQAFDREHLRVRQEGRYVGGINLCAEVDWYLRLEERMKAQWNAQRVALGWESISTIRLATTGGGGKRVGMILDPAVTYSAGTRYP